MLQMNLIQLKDMCYKKNVSIMCSTDTRRLAELVNMDDVSGNEASRDLHCILVTVSQISICAAAQLTNGSCLPVISIKIVVICTLGFMIGYFE